MANMKSLAKDTAIYGLSSIVGRFLNYLLVPLYTHYMPKDSGDYGISTNMYAYTALILVLLTFGMETTLFRFANDEAPSDAQQGKRWPDTVFTTSFAVVGTLTAIFLILLFSFITPISNALGYQKHPDYLLMMGVVVALDALQAIPFSYLRFQKRPIRFASLKLLFIFMNIALNLIFFVWLGKTSVFYVFFLNLLCTGFITFFFIPDLLHIQWHFDGKLLRRMFSYSWPILVLGVAGILNQVADKILFPLIYPDRVAADIELGIYGSCVKIAMIMAMITQAFRYAYEPIVFAKSKDADKGEYYASAMKYFLIFTLLAFICVIGWMPVLKYIIGSGYREGLGVVPIVMAAEIMMGIYFNLSFWYVGGLSRPVSREHPADSQIQLLGLCLGRCGRLWYIYAAELLRRTEEEPHPLPDERDRMLCATGCFHLVHDPVLQRSPCLVAYPDHQYRLDHGLRGIYHQARPAIGKYPRYWKIF